MNWLKLLFQSRAIIFNLLFFVYIFHLYIPIKHAELILGICSLLALLISLPGNQLFYKVIISLALAFSYFVIYSHQLFTWNAIHYFSGMTNILVLVAYSSVFAIPVVLGEYPKKIYLFFKYKVTSFRSMYMTFSFVSFILCSVMSVSAIPTIQTSLANFLKELPQSIVTKFQAMTFVRPYIMTLFWTPVATAPAIVIAGTGAKASVVLSLTFAISLVFLLIDTATSYLRFRGVVNEQFQVEIVKQQELLSKAEIRSLIYFLLNILIFVVITLCIGQWLSYSILDAVVMVIFPYSIIWSLCLKRGREFFFILKTRLNETVPKIYSQVALFIAISVFINVIEQSDISGVINNMVQLISRSIGPYILLLIGFIVFIICLTGIIPQLVVVLVTQTLSLELMNVAPEWLSLAILGGVLAGSASSPFTMNANIVAVTLDDIPINVVKHNLVFAVLIFIVTAFLSIILQLYFG
ncbi:hypothetical protein [Bacillus sp. Marseille-P3661]|uniref:hypothetical protein n=1 Tax=Bacillus sp. Marseille-P3661 TaxID=1936234 RepID=UPI000C81F388|nr:hypothetical protein [Bacillus sp. Marseille-P3661]